MRRQAGLPSATISACRSPRVISSRPARRSVRLGDIDHYGQHPCSQGNTRASVPARRTGRRVADSRAAPSRSRRRGSRPSSPRPSEPGVEPAERPGIRPAGVRGRAWPRRGGGLERHTDVWFETVALDDVLAVTAVVRSKASSSGPRRPPLHSPRTRITVADAPSAPGRGRNLAQPRVLPADRRVREAGFRGFAWVGLSRHPDRQHGSPRGVLPRRRSLDAAVHSRTCDGHGKRQYR